MPQVASWTGAAGLARLQVRTWKSESGWLAGTSGTVNSTPLWYAMIAVRPCCGAFRPESSAPGGLRHVGEAGHDRRLRQERRGQAESESDREPARGLGHHVKDLRCPMQRKTLASPATRGCGVVHKVQRVPL